MRATDPCPDFYTPRWHGDGQYYPPYEGEHQKIVLTLKGAGTLLNPLPAEELAKFNKLFQQNRDKPDLQQIMADATDCTHVVQAKLHEPYLYITGADHAAIHSEPSIHEDHLFMSLVPGTIEQIADLRQDRNAKDSTYA